MICLESDNESEGGSGRGKWKEIETGENNVAATSEWSSRDIESTRYLGMLIYNCIRPFLFMVVLCR